MENRILELRQKNNLTLKELGQKIGMANNTLSQYETGKREPKLETWQKLADFFDVPIAYLQGTTSYIKKYELWTCSRCEKHFFATEEPKHCPYCGSTKRLCYGTSKTISF
ncbi:helix-turn-helix domain-containing protein [Lactobacillus helveticus]|uniref:helix-turn-helix domain-containing protein n=1 Tax=Lactobacillus helveticus TaxID=1587 RepID=UPI001A085002|nr:helix-turn-helix transcriptional regulator [Lactobacillus helveticus]NRO57395.1 HTH-type transcriptional regulator ImmR [Lactobacillus helveticus]